MGSGVCNTCGRVGFEHGPNCPYYEPIDKDATIARLEARVARLASAKTRAEDEELKCAAELDEARAALAEAEQALRQADKAMDVMAWRLDAVATKGLTMTEQVSAEHFKRCIASRDAARAAAERAKSAREGEGEVKNQQYDGDIIGAESRKEGA